MASAAAPLPADPPATTPKAIRTALLPEEVADFDRDRQQALASAAKSLSLDELYSVLGHWYRVACLTQADPAAHRRMLRRAEHTLRTGERPAGTVSADDVKALIRERLGL